MAKRPHLVIINPDQMRADALAHLGNPAAVTPHLDQLADQLLTFYQATCDGVPFEKDQRMDASFLRHLHG